MSIGWITLPSSWHLADVQATARFITWLLGVTGIMAFPCLWYPKLDVTTLKTIDAVFSATSQVLFEPGLRIIPSPPRLLVLLLLAAITAFSDDISLYSIRSASRIEPRQVDGLLAGTGPQFGTGELKSIYAREVLLNETMASLDSAGFPTDQLLDYLPLNSVGSWVYQPEEWNSTWGSTCDFTEETSLNITADPDYPIVDPVHAFPEFGATLDQNLLDPTEYRYSVDFRSWFQ